MRWDDFLSKGRSIARLRSSTRPPAGRRASALPAPGPSRVSRFPGQLWVPPLPAPPHPRPAEPRGRQLPLPSWTALSAGGGGGGRGMTTSPSDVGTHPGCPKLLRTPAECGRHRRACARGASIPARMGTQALDFCSGAKLSRPPSILRKSNLHIRETFRLLFQTAS